MNSRIRIAHLFIAALVAVAAMIGAQASFAQPIFGPPNCTSVTVTNNHPTCTAQLQFRTSPPNVWPAFALAPGGVAVLPIPVATGVQVFGLIDVFGAFRAFNPPPPPVAVCGPNAWWVTNVFLGPAATCRFTVCADPVACTITLF